jgi:putative transposase
MRKSKISENQIISLPKEVEKGRAVKDVCREYSVSEATYYQWKSKYGGMQPSDVRRLRRSLLRESCPERCHRKKALTPQKRREIVETLRHEQGLSERRAWQAARLRRSVYRIKGCPVSFALSAHDFGAP